LSASATVILTGYFAGLALVLATPGPNLLLVGGLAALHGLARTLPLALGLGAGAGVLGAVVYAMAGLMPTGAAWDTAGKVLSAGLLAAMAARIARIPIPVAGVMARGPGLHADFATAFATAITNPITGLFFASQFVGPAGELSWLQVVPLMLVTTLLVMLKAITVAAVFSRAVVRDRVATAFGVWSKVVAALFLVLAGLSLRPVIVAIVGN
jgi:threonine/homoserine/homoserine lactone efflux protein